MDSSTLTKIDQEDSEKLSLTTFWGLELWYDQNEKLRRRTFLKFQNLKEKLDGRDPISYIYDLYFGETKSSLRVIINKILEIDWISSRDFVSSATLQRLLFWDDWLNWKPRPKTQRTPVHQRLLQESIEERTAWFQSRVSDLLGSRESTKIFDMSLLQSKPYRIQKTLYLLKSLWGVDRKMLFEISQELESDNATISHAINKILQQILDNYPMLEINYDEVKLYPQSISRWRLHEANRQSSDKW